MSALVSIFLVCKLKSPSSRILQSVVSWSTITQWIHQWTLLLSLDSFFEYGGLYIAIRVMFFPGRLSLHLTASKLLGLSISRVVIIRFDFKISSTPLPQHVSWFILCSTKVSLLNADMSHHPLISSLFSNHVSVIIHISILFSLIYKIIQY